MKTVPCFRHVCLSSAPSSRIPTTGTGLVRCSGFIACGTFSKHRGVVGAPVKDPLLCGTALVSSGFRVLVSCECESPK